MKIYHLIFLIIMSTFLYGKTTEYKELFKKGIDFYNKGKYEKAVEIFSKLSKKYNDPDIYYNLGNSYAKSGKKGYALLNYKKALKLNPDDEDIKYNIDIISRNLEDKIDTHNNLLNNFLSSTWPISGYSATFFLIIGFILFSLKIIWKKTIPFWIWISITLIGLLLYTISYSGYKLFIQPKGIILTKVCNVRIAPLDNEAITFTLHEGTEVEIKKKSGEWLRIMLPNGLSGWVKKSCIGIFP